MHLGIIYLLGDETISKDLPKATLFFQIAAAQNDHNWAKERAQQILSLLTQQEIEKACNLTREVIAEVEIVAPASAQNSANTNIQ